MSEEPKLTKLKVMLKTYESLKTLDTINHAQSFNEKPEQKAPGANSFLDNSEVQKSKRSTDLSYAPTNLHMLKQATPQNKKKVVSNKSEQQPLNLVMKKKKLSVVKLPHTITAVTSASNTSIPINVNNASSSKCKFCGKFYTSIKELKEHEKGHITNKELSCDECGMGFARRSYLAEHACIHNGEKPHKCYYCNRAFALRCNLVRHVRIHTGEKPYSCNICKKDFILKKNMIEHRRTHTGEKPFKCEYCDFNFSRRSSLVRHFRAHTGEKLYECFECHRTFPWKYNLVRHVEVHLKSKTSKPKRRCIKKKENKADIELQAKQNENCDSQSKAAMGCEHITDSSVDIENPENVFKMDEKRFEIKQEELEETEILELEEKIHVYEDTNFIAKESCVPEEKKHLKVVVAPFILNSFSAAVTARPLSSKHSDSVISEPNDTISFKMTAREFENFCGRRLHVKLHRLEDSSVRMHEE